MGEFGAYPDNVEHVEWMRTFGRIMDGFENDATDWRIGYVAWWFIPEQYALVQSDWVTPTASGNALIEAIKAGRAV